MGWDHEGCPELTTLRELDLSEFNRNEG
jgi:hypothetical protein